MNVEQHRQPAAHGVYDVFLDASLQARDAGDKEQQQAETHGWSESSACRAGICLAQGPRWRTAATERQPPGHDRAPIPRRAEFQAVPVGYQKSSCSVKRKVRPSLSVLVMRPKLGDVMLVVGSAN